MTSAVNGTFGICCEPEDTAVYADAGFDYFECTVAWMLCASEDYRKRIAGAALPCRVANCFLPGDLKITGENIDRKRIADYVEKALSRAAECGIETIVFGSGSARDHAPDFPAERAAGQILEFVQGITPALDRYGVTLAVEPLSVPDSNMINSVGAGAALVNAVAHPRVKLLADSYHFYRMQDAMDSLVWSLPLLQHIHVATLPSRLAPGMEEFDFAPFLNVLKNGGYSKRISVECHPTADRKKDAESAIALLRRIWG